jgi:hypothetical protein
MTTLMIRDLPFADEMDCTEMAKVSGGELPQQITDTINFVALHTHGTCNAAGTVCLSAS